MSKLILFMSLLSLFGCCRKGATTYLQDKITARDGSTITLTFYAHASLGIEHQGRQFYIDPVGEAIDWQSQPKADAVLITHSHYDHLELPTVELLAKSDCAIICDKTSAESFDHDCTTMVPGAIAQPFEDVEIRAVAAYNISEGHTDFHPQSREDCGYVITLGGTSIYVPGDTEDNEDVVSQRDIDVLFLPVNQPYTMTVEQAVRVVKAIKPTIFYPYHYGQVEEKTDIDALVAALEGVCEVRVRPME